MVFIMPVAFLIESSISGNKLAPNYEVAVKHFLHSDLKRREKWFVLKWYGKRVGYIKEQWKLDRGSINWQQQLKITGKGRGLKVTTIHDEQLTFSSQAPYLLLSGDKLNRTYQGSQKIVDRSSFRIDQNKVVISENGRHYEKNYPQAYSISQHLFPILLGKLAKPEKQYQIKLWDMDTFKAVDYTFNHYFSDGKIIRWDSKKFDEQWQSIWRYTTAGELEERILAGGIEKVPNRLMSYQSSTREEAESLDSNQHFTQHEYIKIDRPLGNISKIATLELELNGSDKISTEQTRVGGILHIGQSKQSNFRADDAALYSKASRRYPDLPQLKDILHNLYQPGANTFDKVKTLVNFVSDFIENSDVLSQSSVQSILNNPKGDCTEHALLFVALARSSGIPAREVNGLLYLGDEQQKYQAHVWAEVFIQHRWLAVDPTWDRWKLDPGYIQIYQGLNNDSSSETTRLAISGKRFHLKSIHYL